MTTFNENEYVKATWSDGLVIFGKYKASIRGYIILVDHSDQEVACNQHAVQFEKINKEEYINARHE